MQNVASVSMAADQEIMQEEEKRERGLYDLLWMAGVATCIKLLLVPTYHSTDLEVHRNWLAITHSLPLSSWYVDQTSPWTLDYPPFFAWLERFFALFAQWVDPKMVNNVEGLNYASERVVLFQRSTVILTDGVLYWALWRCCRKLPVERQRLIFMAIVWSPGLFIVDHIHFQYNGFLLGLLLLSLSFLANGNDLIGGVIFAMLLCFKHLFAVAAPVYFIYLLRHYCRGPHKFQRFITLAMSVIGVVTLAFGPFAYLGQMNQVLKRLFPFGRGLCHAYWAPNFWALYNISDKVLAFTIKKLGFQINSQVAAMTGGLVGDFSSYVVLPQITPATTFLLVILALLPCLMKIWKHAKQSEVFNWVSYAYMCGFMFGWHVHEKASLHFVIPSTFLALSSPENAADYIFLSTVSYYSLFPLLFEMREYPIKVMLLLMHTMLMWVSFSIYFSSIVPGVKKLKEDVSDSYMDQAVQSGNLSNTVVGTGKHRVPSPLLEMSKFLYLFGLVIVELFGQVLHPAFLRQKFPFLPLLVVSVYCALGMLYIWAKQFLDFLHYSY